MIGSEWVGCGQCASNRGANTCHLFSHASTSALRSWRSCVCLNARQPDDEGFLKTLEVKQKRHKSSIPPTADDRVGFDCPRENELRCRQTCSRGLKVYMAICLAARELRRLTFNQPELSYKFVLFPLKGSRSFLCLKSASERIVRISFRALCNSFALKNVAQKRGRGLVPCSSEGRGVFPFDVKWELQQPRRRASRKDAVK